MVISHKSDIDTAAANHPAESPQANRNLAHLLRRAGFGASPKEWGMYKRLGLAGTTEYLLNPERQPDRFSNLLNELKGDYVDFTNIESLKGWWIYRMIHTNRPLEEKMTLYWHNHFATAMYKVENSERMWNQNELFRANALGNFRTLLKGVSRDPAMLHWLDGAENRKGKPNENYGRELMELFTMGVNGGYTEKDVKEAARAFTGWKYDGDTNTFVFDPNQHDDDKKTFLGETGNFNGDDIIDILVRQPATAKYLCTKLFKFFVHDTPSDKDISPLVKIYFAAGYDIKAILRSIFTSPSFYSDRALYAKIKSPSESLVITTKTLNVPMTILGYIPNLMRDMGQDLFNPPNVKGWPEGQTWINSMTLLTRVNLANRSIMQLAYRNELLQRIMELTQAHGLQGEQVSTPADAVEGLWTMLIPGRPPSEKTKTILVTYASHEWKPGEKKFIEKAPGLIKLIMSAPEYQLA